MWYTESFSIDFILRNVRRTMDRIEDSYGV